MRWDYSLMLKVSLLCPPTNLGKLYFREHGPELGQCLCGGMVYTTDLKSVALYRHGGSSPPRGTISNIGEITYADF